MSDAFLPKEWRECELGSLFGHVIGGDWGKDPSFEAPDFIDVACIRGSEFRHWDKEKGSTASVRKIKKSSLVTRELEVGDILIEISGGGPDQPVGRTVLIEDCVLKQHLGMPIVCTNFLRLARPVSSVDSSYLNSYLRSFYLSGEVVNYQGGSNNLRNLKFKDYVTIPIPLPPLAEQKEIAERLDDLLAQVDTLKTRLDAIPVLLKRFRQSTLAAATSGKLTEEWRVEKSHTRPLECIDWKWTDVPANWSVVYYDKAVESRLGKMLDKSKNTGVPTSYLGNINVRWFAFELDMLQQILVSEKEVADLTVEKGDVLICEGGEPGRAAIWKEDGSQKIIFQKALHRARVSKSLMPDWLVYNLKNDADNQTLQQLFTGTTIKHLTGKALKQYPLRMPPLKEQTEIVRRVEELFTFADQVEQRVTEAQAHVNHLTQSILAKAFRGELTESWRKENPDLITGENSAQSLLARIKSERAKMISKKNTRKKGRS